MNNLLKTVRLHNFYILKNQNFVKLYHIKMVVNLTNSRKSIDKYIKL